MFTSNFEIFSKFFFLLQLFLAIGIQLETYAQESQSNQELYLELFTDYNNNDNELNEIVRVNSEHFSKSCSRGSFYYSFNPECQKDVSTVEQLLIDEDNTTLMIDLAKRLRDDPRIHPKVWYSALSRASLARDDLRGLRKPNPWNVMPEDFISRDVIEQAMKEQKGEQNLDASSKRVGEKSCVMVDETFSGGDPLEKRLWYFREDVQVNSHHWFWHAQYPSVPPSPPNSFSYNPIHADRRGELFYYLHHSMMARYNAERLSNDLPLTTSIDLRYNYVMKDPYIANLDDTNSGTPWTSRTRPTKIPESVALRSGQDGRAITYVLLNRTIESRNRLLQSIDNGYLETNRGRVSLRTFEGIDRLVDVIEASVFSLNLNYYGSMHGSGHILIGLAHDPTNPDAIPTVMGDSATSMRDFIFFNWHGMIDVMFDRHKKTLLPYRPTKSEFPLLWNSVIIDDVSVSNTNSNDDSTVNVLNTFWSYKKIGLTSGLGFDRNTNLPPVQLCLKHLNHDDFTYQITLRSSAAQAGTIRIFLAPRFDENGQRYKLEQQRSLFFVLDTFSVALTSGQNIITRDSTKSTLTIPWGDGLYNVDQTNKRPYCGCGWPYHLLLPKGKEDGMTFDLFIMMTNGQEDQLSQMESPNNGDNSNNYCHSAPLLCGIPNKRYPDTKPMGYPFDRVPYTVFEQQQQGKATSYLERQVVDLEEYVKFVPNAFTTQVVIEHENRLDHQITFDI